MKLLKALSCEEHKLSASQGAAVVPSAGGGGAKAWKMEGSSGNLSAEQPCVVGPVSRTPGGCVCWYMYM